MSDDDEDGYAPLFLQVNGKKIDKEDFEHVAITVGRVLFGGEIKAAYEINPDNPEDREVWVLDRAKALLVGHATDVAVGLRRAVTWSKIAWK